MVGRSLFSIKAVLCLLLIFLISLLGLVAVNAQSSSTFVSVADSNCYDYSTNITCESNNCFWEDGGGNPSLAHCEEVGCFVADSTNTTYCNNLNTTFNLSYSCGWEIHATGLCDPIGGDFKGNGCSDFDGDEQDCYDTYFCLWNSTSTTCDEPFGGFSGGAFNGDSNPSCELIMDSSTCSDISGCSFVNGECTGNPDGITCGDINQSICSDVTFLSTCCNWNGTICQTSLDQSCYNSIPAQPTGAEFCEDFKVFKNETLCKEIAGDPWYMPCKWDNESEICGFNNHAFGDKSGFDEIGTELGCEAQGGLWKTGQYIDDSGSIRTDTWCEFAFGTGGNCDSSCWSCENEVNPATACVGSDLGYCEWTADTKAFNGVGWCNPKDEVLKGGINCDSNCKDCNALNDPQTACGNSDAECRWSTDPSDSSVGWCEGSNVKTCDSDCWSCYDEPNCETYGNGGSDACRWDEINYFCKPSDFSGEICFDGVDNDGNGLIDCGDPTCGFDTFCGGSMMGDCGKYQINTTCLAASTTFGSCVWIEESFGSWCGMPGEQCWMQDDDQTACDLESGCGWQTGNGGFCEVNGTQEELCFQNDDNQTACNLNSDCKWATSPYDSGEGWCDAAQYECEWNQTLQQDSSTCESNLNCIWDLDSDFGQPGCSAKCWSFDDNQTACGLATSCEWVTGLCEPDFFLGNCPQYDGTNLTACEFNPQCSWVPGANLCNDLFSTQMFQQMDPGMPELIGSDPVDGVEDYIDITGFGVKDMGDSYGLATMVVSLDDAAVCNGYPLLAGGNGIGVNTAKYYWYLDSDGVTSGGCNATGVSQDYTGFEFLFSYESIHNGADTIETRTAKRCVGGNWAPTNIPVSGESVIMCDEINGAMIALEKEAMDKFSDLFDDDEDLRFFLTTANDSTTRDLPLDESGPVYFSPGSVDFHFEDCMSGGDADNDGLVASMDPDCFDYFKYGFAPSEFGFECNDGLDNDVDGLTDCNDPGCAFDTFVCGGAGLVVDPTDNSAPKIKWLNVETFPDAAYVMFDTNEPANGTLRFYLNDSSCGDLNATIRDTGLIESFIPDYRLKHDAPIDNYSFNPDRLNNALDNATAYFYKLNFCDISGNCANSACLNFTTKSNLEDCNGCTSTFNFPFTPKGVTTDPLGSLQFRFVLPDGTEFDLAGGSASGKQLDYTQLKRFDVIISNPTAASGTYWELGLINSSVNGKVPTDTQTFVGGLDLTFNSTTVGSFVGAGNNKCQELINTFRPIKLDIGIPGNITELWHCGSTLKNCTERTNESTNVGFNVTLNMTTWRVPAEWGC